MKSEEVEAYDYHRFPTPSKVQILPSPPALLDTTGFPR